MDSLSSLTKLLLAKHLENNQLAVRGFLNMRDREFLAKHPKMLLHAYIWSKFKETKGK